MSEKVKLVTITPDAENLIAYCARVSNPKNQDSDNISKLLQYCIKEKHLSIFEMANLVVEINTTLAIAPQILRHKSFSFQQFSARYAEASLLNEEIPMFELRKQDLKNRQNSTNDLDQDIIYKWNLKLREHLAKSQSIYNGMVKDGVAKECARNILSSCTPTRLYANGTIRSWITYIALREKNGTQKEHQEIAKECKKIFCEQLPIVGESLGGYEKEWVI